MTDCDKCKEYDKEKNYCPVFCNVINDTLTDKAIEELEKIKAEIEDIRLSEENVDSSWCAGLKYVDNKIIDKHISELKGENNE